MLFKNLIGDCDCFYRGEQDLSQIDVESISQDSKDVLKGGIYFCLTDDVKKANSRCIEALQNGARVVVSKFDLSLKEHIMVDDVRKVFSTACANFYERACDGLKIVGITGTNGKTSTSHIVAQMLRRNGKKVGVIGTNGVYFDGRKYDCPLTTPDADFLHKTFFEMKKAGVEYIVMEVSAHAIDQKRIDGINFDVGVLTNITQDHLDYFKTMEEYEKTKLSFFDPSYIKCGIVCADDQLARKLLDESKVPLISYGLNNPSDVFAIDVGYFLDGSNFVANVCDEVLPISTNLVGEYNVYNSLASLAVCYALGLSPEELKLGITHAQPVEGRFNVINVGGKYAVVDFAHTPDGLYQILKSCRELTNGKLFVVFGCGGNRDRTKRSQMGKIAEEYADFVCLTDDNPRCENGDLIIQDIEKGMDKYHFVEHDRAKAIAKMLDLARRGDMVVVAGKGAEPYQEIGHQKLQYSDFDVIFNYHKNQRQGQYNSERNRDLL